MGKLNSMKSLGGLQSHKDTIKKGKNIISISDKNYEVSVWNKVIRGDPHQEDIELKFSSNFSRPPNNIISQIVTKIWRITVAAMWIVAWRVMNMRMLQRKGVIVLQTRKWKRFSGHLWESVISLY